MSYTEIKDILEPHKAYQNGIKSAHHDNANAYFEELSKKANVDVDANRQTVKEYREVLAKIDELEKNKNKKNGLKTFLIICIVLFFILAAVGIILAIAKKSYWIAIGVVSALIFIGLAVWFIIIIKKKINSAIKDFENKIAKEKAKAEELLAKAWAQMRPLNSLYDWNMPAILVSKTIPLIEMDKYFDARKYEYLHEKYGFMENSEDNVSTIFVQSGSILGNPFLIERNYVQDMMNETYTGSITIHWTTTHRDSQGRTYTEHHSEVLTASVTKPKPYYYKDTWLVYGNEAAPKLSYSRQPSDANNMNEKQIEKLVKKYDKKLDDLVADGLKSGNGFTRMSDTEFEALYNAINRDNEVDFRLLFTPLAIKNTLAQIKSKTPYGDDFSFVKRKCLNYVKSSHAQGANFYSDPECFYNYCYDDAKKYFIDACDTFMQSLFYDLMPVINIPIYQQHKSHEYIYKDNYYANITRFETESLANAYNPAQFKSAQSVTETILKSELIKKGNGVDVVGVHGHGFKAIQHVSYISKYGGDGKWHDVPVTWYEYVPVDKVTEMAVQATSASKQEYDTTSGLGNLKKFLEQYSKKGGMIYQKGLISYLLNGNYNNLKGEELNKLFTNNKEE